MTGRGAGDCRPCRSTRASTSSWQMLAGDNALVVKARPGLVSRRCFGRCGRCYRTRLHRAALCGVEVEAKLSFLALGDLLGAVIDDCGDAVRRSATPSACPVSSRRQRCAGARREGRRAGCAQRVDRVGRASPSTPRHRRCRVDRHVQRHRPHIVARRLDEQAVGFLATTRTPPRSSIRWPSNGPSAPTSTPHHPRSALPRRSHRAGRQRLPVSVRAARVAGGSPRPRAGIRCSPSTSPVPSTIRRSVTPVIRWSCRTT